MAGACFSLLDFEPAEHMASWHTSTSDRPSVSEMLRFIAEAMERWKEIVQSGPGNENRINQVVEEFESKFVSVTCQEEDVGISDVDIIRNIFGHNRMGYQDCNDRIKSEKILRTKCGYQETLNLCRTYKLLQELGREAKKDPETVGLLEVDSCIADVHECLMNDLSMMTPGGRFSTGVRQTVAYGELHQYPKFETELEARDAVIRILDRYNALHFSIKQQNSCIDEEYLGNFFKCAAWVFYELVSLHPFGDGNGRLCRLILNYIIQTITPFPVPLFDAFGLYSRETYLHAVVEPRKSDGRPKELMTLIVASTYSCWHEFLKRVDVSEKVLDMREALDKVDQPTLDDVGVRCETPEIPDSPEDFTSGYMLLDTNYLKILKPVAVY